MRFFYKIDGNIVIETFKLKKIFIYIQLNFNEQHKADKCIIRHPVKIETSSLFKEIDLLQLYFDKDVRKKLLEYYPIPSFDESCNNCNYECNRNDENQILFNKLNKYVKKINKLLKNLQELDSI